jgi:hypothetical protein
MAIVDNLVSQPPQSVYLFPTPTSAVRAGRFPGLPRPLQNESLYFQYWPQSLSDDYQVEYAEHAIPGGSHPIYQWVGGRGRTISFEAVFTSEVNTSRTLAGGIGDIASRALGGGGSAVTEFLPSAPYTVDVAAALSKIRSWMLPDYSEGGRLGETDPPKILTLVFPNTKLAGKTDLITVILRSAPVTYESWYPNGQPRIATVQLTFNEIVQSPSGSGQSSGTKVKFIGRKDFVAGSEKYRFRGLPDRPFAGG